MIRRHSSMSKINPDNAITHESSEHILSYHLKTNNKEKNRSSCPDFENILDPVSASPVDIVLVRDEVEKDQQRQDPYTQALADLSEKVENIMALLEKDQSEKNFTLKALSDYLNKLPSNPEPDVDGVQEVLIDQKDSIEQPVVSRVKELVMAIENRERTQREVLDPEEVEEILNAGKRRLDELLQPNENDFDETKFNEEIQDNSTPIPETSLVKYNKEETVLSRSLSESNLKKEMKFSISTDDLDDDQVLSLFIDGENINVTASSRTLASSSIDITSTETGFSFRLCSKQKSQNHIPVGKSFSEENILMQTIRSESMEELTEQAEDEVKQAESIEEELQGIQIECEEPEKHVSFVEASSKDDFIESDVENSVNLMDDDSFSISTVVENESWGEESIEKKPQDFEKVACDVQIDFEDKSISSSNMEVELDEVADQRNFSSSSSSSSAEGKLVRPKRRTILRATPIVPQRRDVVIAPKVTVSI